VSHCSFAGVTTMTMGFEKERKRPLGLIFEKRRG